MCSNRDKDKFAASKEVMIKQHLKARDITDPAVLSVIAQIPRQEFIPESYQADAYSDLPLPIGMGQTISQPYIVALMTQFLRLNPACKVLEIGTGSGYQTAILAKLAHRVYTVERYHQLCESAQAVLGRLGIDNVEFYIGDGSKGWQKSQQFDRIIITAAVPQIPDPISEQLVEAGILVAPVGELDYQELVVCEKKEGKLQRKIICGCRFVKLIGEYGFSEQ